MKKEDVAKILAILKIAYPNFYKDTKGEEIESTVQLYQEMFSDCDAGFVAIAVKELINTFQYPPTIADIKNKMYDLYNRDDDKSPSELWDILLRAIRNGAYGYLEEFEKLPNEVKEFVRRPEQLKELALMDSNTIHSVVKGQFLKQIDIIKRRIKEDTMMLSSAKQMLVTLKERNLLDNKQA